jgi:hypothetical protein
VKKGRMKEEEGLGRKGKEGERGNSKRKRKKKKEIVDSSCTPTIDRVPILPCEKMKRLSCFHHRNRMHILKKKYE